MGLLLISIIIFIPILTFLSAVRTNPWNFTDGIILASAIPLLCLVYILGMLSAILYYSIHLYIDRRSYNKVMAGSKKDKPEYSDIESIDDGNIYLEENVASKSEQLAKESMLKSQLSGNKQVFTIQPDEKTMLLPLQETGESRWLQPLPKLTPQPNIREEMSLPIIKVLTPLPNIIEETPVRVLTPLPNIKEGTPLHDEQYSAKIAKTSIKGGRLSSPPSRLVSRRSSSLPVTENSFGKTTGASRRYSLPPIVEISSKNKLPPLYGFTGLAHGMRETSVYTDDSSTFGKKQIPLPSDMSVTEKEISQGVGFGGDQLLNRSFTSIKQQVTSLPDVSATSKLEGPVLEAAEILPYGIRQMQPPLTTIKKRQTTSQPEISIANKSGTWQMQQLLLVTSTKKQTTSLPEISPVDNSGRSLSLYYSQMDGENLEKWVHEVNLAKEIPESKLDEQTKSEAVETRPLLDENLDISREWVPDVSITKEIPDSKLDRETTEAVETRSLYSLREGVPDVIITKEIPESKLDRQTSEAVETQPLLDENLVSSKTRIPDVCITRESFDAKLDGETSMAIECRPENLAHEGRQVLTSPDISVSSLPKPDVKTGWCITPTMSHEDFQVYDVNLTHKNRQVPGDTPLQSAMSMASMQGSLMDEMDFRYRKKSISDASLNLENDLKWMSKRRTKRRKSSSLPDVHLYVHKSSRVPQKYLNKERRSQYMHSSGKLSLLWDIQNFAKKTRVSEATVSSMTSNVLPMSDITFGSFSTYVSDSPRVSTVSYRSMTGRGQDDGMWEGSTISDRSMTSRGLDNRMRGGSTISDRSMTSRGLDNRMRDGSTISDRSMTSRPQDNRMRDGSTISDRDKWKTR